MISRRRRLPDVEKRRIAARQQFRCGECRELLTEHWEIDHVVALSAGGRDDASNMQALHPNCHAAKTLWDVRVAARLRAGGADIDCVRCGAVVSVFWRHACFGGR